jgi:hypothetical protein
MAIKVNGCTVIDDSRNVNAGVSTAATGCVTGTLTAGTATVPGTVTGGVVCATSCFSGSGSGLSNIPSGAITGSLGGIRVCTFSSPGTFSVPPGTTTLKITAIGGGGNGSSCPLFGGDQYRSGGGGAGAAAVKYLTVPPACSSYPVTIGGAGGDTVFGGPTVFLTEGGCTGCGGGCFSGGSQGNYGCVPSTATHLISNPGQVRQCSCTLVTSAGGAPGSIYGSSGHGQSSYFGTGGGYCFRNATGFGAGGSSGDGGPVAAGTGSPGFVIVEW